MALPIIFRYVVLLLMLCYVNKHPAAPWLTPYVQI